MACPAARLRKVSWKSGRKEIRAETPEDARVDGLGRGSPDKTNIRLQEEMVSSEIDIFQDVLACVVMHVERKCSGWCVILDLSVCKWRGMPKHCCWALDQQRFASIAVKMETC